MEYRTVQQPENSYNPLLPPSYTLFSSSFLSSSLHQNKLQYHNNNNNHRQRSQNGLTALSLPDVKIHFETQNRLPNSTPHPSALFEDLNYSIPRNSFSSQQPSTTILPNVVTTAPQQPSPWPTQPQSTSPLAPHSQQQQQQQPSPQTDYQTPPDFVLFPRRSLEASPSAQNTPNLPRSHALSGSNRRHSANPSLSASSLQNQRVAAIIQGTGHSVTPPAFTNRYNSFPQNQHFYALSAPSSSAALQSQKRTRPQVPLFTQSTGSIPSRQSFPTVNMAQDMNLFDDFDTTFDLKTSDNVTFPDLDYNHSPAVPTMYSPAPPMTRSDSASTSMGTVSPQDLMVRDATFSAPNSTVFTNLTSPSNYNESPDYLHGFDVSPMYTADGLDHADPWFPLFPESDATYSTDQVADCSLPKEEVLEVAEAVADRRRRSVSSPQSKASAHAGVSARKRNQPLPPIVVEDPNDTIAIKRARNTLAARKSRQKKMERFDELEAEIARIAAERDMWKAKALARGAN